MRAWIQQRIPSPEALQQNRCLRWLGPLLHRPWLWQFSRRRVAMGAAIGVFFGFLIPVLQIAGAALLALVLRANLPVAAFSTLVSNPFTYAPIGVLAYRTGSALLGDQVDEQAARALGQPTAIDTAAGAPTPSWAERAKAIGKPLFLGLAVFAVVGASLTWLGVQGGWRLAVYLKRRGRHRAPLG